MEDTNNNMNIKQLVNILLQGEEQRRQLELQLNEQEKPCAKSLASMLQQTLEQAIDLARSFEAVNLHDQVEASDSPRGSGSYGPASPISEGSERKGISKKRKCFPKWTRQVQVPNPNSSSPEIVAPDDGYSWRKYGQKDILRAKFPRAYYRCTHQKTQQCLATRQVQRSDEDPTIFNITYLGHHTCTQNVGQTSTPMQQTLTQQLEHNQQVIIRFNSVPTGNQGTNTYTNVPPFSFSDNSADQAIFSPASNSFGGFITSEGTSDSVFLSDFQSHYGEYGDYSDFHKLDESELGEIVSGRHSAANDFTAKVSDPETDFPFDPMNAFK